MHVTQENNGKQFIHLYVYDHEYQHKWMFSIEPHALTPMYPPKVPKSALPHPTPTKHPIFIHVYLLINLYQKRSLNVLYDSLNSPFRRMILYAYSCLMRNIDQKWKSSEISWCLYIWKLFSLGWWIRRQEFRCHVISPTHLIFVWVLTGECLWYICYLSNNCWGNLSNSGEEQMSNIISIRNMCKKSQLLMKEKIVIMTISTQNKPCVD